MNVNEIWPSKYIKAMDLNGRDITVEIDRLAIEEIGVPPKIEAKPVLYFKKAKKSMVCNRVNGMTIAAMYGPETAAWEGKRVTLFPTRVTAFGSVFEVIRIRPQMPPPPKPQETKQEETHFADSEDIPDDDVNDPTATVVEGPPPSAPVEQTNGKIYRKIGAITDKQMKELNALLNSLHPGDPDFAKHALVEHVTDGKYKSSTDLTQAQAMQLIAKLHQELSALIGQSVDKGALNLLLIKHKQTSLLDANPVSLTHIWKDVQERTAVAA